MPRRQAHEEFVQKIESKYPGKYEFLTEHINYKSQIKIRYKKCGHIETRISDEVDHGCNCQECRKLNFKNNFITKFYNLKNSEEFEITGEYIGNKTNIEITHKCGYSFNIYADLTNRKELYCPKCNPEKINTCIPYINDMSITHPEVYELLEDKNDGHKYKGNSHAYVWFICPYCGERIYARISYVSTWGLVCRKCGKSSSYAEKFMANILTELGVKYKTQFSPKWANRKMYDFMFEFNKIKYIIEMDGKFHSEDNEMNGQTKEESKKIDLLKDKLAQDHGYKMIRIDCNYKSPSKRYKCILNNILKSELSNVFDLSNINFELCNQKAYISDVSIIANLWNRGIYGMQNLINHTRFSKNKVYTCLNRAIEAKLINMTREEVSKINIDIANDIHRKKVKCNETGEIFKSMTEANKKYHCYVYKYLSGINSYAGKLEDGTKLTWSVVE